MISIIVPVLLSLVVHHLRRVLGLLVLIGLTTTASVWYTLRSADLPQDVRWTPDGVRLTVQAHLREDATALLHRMGVRIDDERTPPSANSGSRPVDVDRPR